MLTSSVRSTLAAALLVLVAGCGDDSGTPPSDAASPTASPTGSPTGSPTASASPSATASASPSPTAAQGLLLESQSVSVRGMPSWQSYSELYGTFRLSDVDTSGRDYVAIHEIAQIGESDLRWSARNVAEDRDRSRILKPVELLGQRWYHVTYHDAGSWVHAFGTDMQGRRITLTIGQSDDVPRAQHQPVVDAILATLVWKG